VGDARSNPASPHVAHRATATEDLFLDGDLRLHRVRDETILMREVVHLFEFLLGRLFLTGKLELRMQLDPGNRELALLVLLHMADGVVGVFIEHELFFAGHGEKSQHVAAGERRDEGLFRIGVRRIAQVSRRSRSRHFVAAVEFPGVIAIVSLVLEVGRGALPDERHFVFGHSLKYMRDPGGQALRLPSLGGDAPVCWQYAGCRVRTPARNASRSDAGAVRLSC
jgi:hypothetical protein